MLFRRYHATAVLAGLLLAGLLHAQFTFPPRKHENMEAQLTVQVGRQPIERGLAEVTLTLTVSGPPTLEVEEPRLGDAAAAWNEQRMPSTRTLQDQSAVWGQIIRLKQVKRGPEPLPDVTVRFRRGTDAEWIEEKWTDILRNVYDSPAAPLQGEEGPSWPRRSGFVLVLAATVLLVLTVWLKKRRRAGHAAPLQADQWALAEIERIEKTLIPPQGDAEALHTQISFVVRSYLAQRFGLHALQQTTREFLEAIRQLPHLSAEKQVLLTELLERCDLAKFARVGTAPEECRQTVELARKLVRCLEKGPAA